MIVNIELVRLMMLEIKGLVTLSPYTPETIAKDTTNTITGM